MAAPTYTRFAGRLTPLRPVRITASLFWAAVVMVVVGAVTVLLARGYPEDAPLHHDIFSPVLALELPHSGHDIQIVLKPFPWSDEQQIRAIFSRATYADFFFIVSYTAFLIVAWNGISFGRFRFVIALIVVTALGDVAENAGMLRALGTPYADLTDALAVETSIPSTIKWGCLALVVLAFSSALRRVELKPFRRAGTGVLAIELAIAGVFGLTGLAPDIRSMPAGWFSYYHLETFASLFALFPIVIIAAHLYELWRGRNLESAGAQTLEERI